MVINDVLVIIVFIAFIFVLFNNCNYCHYEGYYNYSDYWSYCIYSGWLGSIGSRVVYELDHKNPILYVIPIQSILGKLPVVPVGDTGTIPPPLSGGAWRPQAGFWRWMPYVVCQFVGIGMVPWYVMKLGGPSARLSCHMEKGSMWQCLQSTIFGALSSPHWWVKANSSWFFQQCRALSRGLPSMRVSNWTVV